MESFGWRDPRQRYRRTNYPHRDSAPGLLDLRATPLDAAVPGIEMHAQVVEQLLTGRFLTRPDYALALEQFVVLTLGIVLALLLPRVWQEPQ